MYFKNMVDISRETYKRKCRNNRTIVDNDGILWWKEKHIEEVLDHKNVLMTIGKDLSTYRKHRYK